MMGRYGSHYSDDSFWKKARKFASKAGREVIEKALVLYYCLEDPETPAWAKMVIASALGYLILPTDAFPDLFPGGFVDDFGVLAAALVTVATHIKPEHVQKAREKVEQWFGPTTEPA